MSPHHLMAIWQALSFSSVKKILDAPGNVLEIMLLKRLAWSSTHSTLQCCICSPQISTSTSPLALPQQRARPKKAHSQRHGQRPYATAKYGTGPDFRDNMNWPCSHTPHSAPTPYEIFDIDRNAAYTKHRFYELVKIYHPDRSFRDGSMIGNITYTEKLERYRLVVQAHEILSDPIKRKAYDAYGAGWGESARNPINRRSRGYSSTAAGRTYGTGRDNDNSPFANATWEDWERWYRRSDDQIKQTYTGTYFNPNAFASFVILLAVLSGVAQATRAGQYSGRLEDKAQAFTEETSRFLSSRADHYVENNIKSDGRIKSFLERRDPTRYGLKDEEEEHYRKHFAGEHVSPAKVYTPPERPTKPDRPPD